MVVFSLSDVFTPRFHHYDTPQHYLVLEQLRLSSHCCSIQRASISTSFTCRKRSALLQTKCSSTEEFPGEYNFNPSKLLVAESALDTQVRELTFKGYHAEAVKHYIDSLYSDLATDGFHSFPVLVKAAGSLSDVELCRQIHGYLLKLGFIKGVHVANSLLSALWKSRAIDDAIRMFMTMQEKDSVSWSTMISGFHQARLYTRSLEWFRCMARESGAFNLHKIGH